MAKILNMPSPRSSRHDGSCRSAQNRIFKPAGMDGVDTLILALEGKGKWTIERYDQRVEWYVRLAWFPMDVLCNAATVILLERNTPDLDAIVRIATQMMKHRATAELKHSRSTLENMDENIGTTIAPNADGNQSETTSKTESSAMSPRLTKMSELIAVMSRIANTLDAIEFHLADRK